MDKLKVFTTFSGYDSQCLALKYLGIDFDLVGWSEIDKYAIQAHNALFPEYAGRNYGDISKIDWAQVPDFDLFTYSSPCQDFSVAGLQRGGDAGSGTRSSLLWECERAIGAKRPKYLLFENVKALVSKKFIGTFNQWRAVLDELGYTSYVQVLNAKHYGVPQNRERIFMVSVLGEDIGYKFPAPKPLQKRLKDVLEDSVGEQYYLSDKILHTFFERNRINKERGNGFKFSPTDGEGISGTVKENHGYPVLDQDGVSDATATTICLNSKVSGKRPSRADRVYDSGGISAAVTCSFLPSIQEPVHPRIRKLTERECFRLMGVRDDDIDKIQAYRDERGKPISKSQQYKMAGNSIVADVLMAIFGNLFDPKDTDRQLTLF